MAHLSRARNHRLPLKRLAQGHGAGKQWPECEPTQSGPGVPALYHHKIEPLTSYTGFYRNPEHAPVLLIGKSLLARLCQLPPLLGVTPARFSACNLPISNIIWALSCAHSCVCFSLTYILINKWNEQSDKTWNDRELSDFSSFYPPLTPPPYLPRWSSVHGRTHISGTVWRLSRNLGTGGFQEIIFYILLSTCSLPQTWSENSVCLPLPFLSYLLLPKSQPAPYCFPKKICFSPILRLTSMHLAGYKSTEWRALKHTQPQRVARTWDRLFHHCLGDRPMEWKVLLIYHSSTQFSYLIFLNKVRFLVTGNKLHIAVLNNKEWFC